MTATLQSLQPLFSFRLLTARLRAVFNRWFWLNYAVCLLVTAPIPFTTITVNGEFVRRGRPSGKTTVHCCKAASPRGPSAPSPRIWAYASQCVFWFGSCWRVPPPRRNPRLRTTMNETDLRQSHLRNRTPALGTRLLSPPPTATSARASGRTGSCVRRQYLEGLYAPRDDRRRRRERRKDRRRRQRHQRILHATSPPTPNAPKSAPSSMRTPPPPRHRAHTSPA